MEWTELDRASIDPDEKSKTQSIGIAQKPVKQHIT
jgi:hypothetical protein